MTNQRSFASRVTKARMKYLSCLILKVAKGEELNKKQQEFFNKYCNVTSQPIPPQ